MDEWEIREVFNRGRFSDRVASGELSIKVAKSKPATNSNIRGWVPGTLSQMVFYYDGEGNIVAKTHRYYRPDGSLAASGLEDPKRVLDGTTMYVLRLPEGGKNEAL